MMMIIKYARFVFVLLLLFFDDELFNAKFEIKQASIIYYILTGEYNTKTNKMDDMEQNMAVQNKTQITVCRIIL